MDFQISCHVIRGVSSPSCNNYALKKLLWAINQNLEMKLLTPFKANFMWMTCLSQFHV